MVWLEQFVTETQRDIPDRVLETLWGRGVTDEQIQMFRIGHIGRNFPDIMLPEPFVRWASNKINDCFVLPITNTLGQVRGVQFRHVEREHRGYMDYIPEQEEAIGFGLAQAISSVWEREEIVLVEGAFDLLPFQRVIPFITSTLTARVTEPFVRLLRRLVRCTWIGYDNDQAGNRAYQKFLQQPGHDFEVRRILCPKVTFGGKSVKDPAELWEAWGDIRIRKFLQSTMGLESQME